MPYLFLPCLLRLLSYIFAVSFLLGNAAVAEETMGQIERETNECVQINAVELKDEAGFLSCLTRIFRSVRTVMITQIALLR